MAKFELIEKVAPNAIIKVIGIGGGGGNAVAHMVASAVEGVEFICANTDSQAIKNSGAKLQLQLGSNVTKGLGAGANPEEIGRAHVCTPVTNAHLVCRLLLEKKKQQHRTHHRHTTTKTKLYNSRSH